MGLVKHDNDADFNGVVTGPTLFTKVEAGSTAGTARPDTDGPVYWFCDNGITLTNPIEGDLIFTREA